ncbi:MAG: 30S ribosome-binding factor RbfA [Candidatus Marinimicrobia bacterium]|jgi:ribosome-binding factor A|nr:30S ribosome-binding factor RbfA [Candidatus Neomarinimicrobiota bacterium]MBT3631165.1 30S ribosome-binding factor RbfA [Candidatus Neomarinimicrobiota bacterium]MBT3825063.1 30S ribosome-binding factor RbfA [Candidatus Neomarinimicrobiota bacterium]MBT4131406.1 30S ribosome-binding factor RbfA [Candidatus Neomarinimicrobiota bacterium]MBT4296885.1 30S ribosome-binding factor RbfA [Candidatus Neomarinimicrobiota bacterium]
MGIARQQRVAEAIRAAVAEYLILNLANVTPGFVSVTKAKMTPDLKISYVYFSIYGNEQDVAFTFKTLEQHNGRVRFHVGKEVPLKYVPELKFFIDDSLGYADKMNRVMKDL